MVELTDEMRARVELLLRDRVTSVVPVPRGYTLAGRWRITLQGGGTAFLKLGTTEHTSEALRLERDAYQELEGPFMAGLLAWEDHPTEPLLVLEDLGAAYWPPPWKRDVVEEVFAALTSIHSSRANLKAFDELHAGIGDGWLRVSQAPEPFLALGLVTSSWLEKALPSLLQASAQVETRGQEVIQLDVRSDNLCHTQRGAVLVDWNWACLGNGALDTGFWLPSLEDEGGPPPEQILPSRPDIAAFVSGFFAARAGLPPSPEAPHVRALQVRQLGPALRWAELELDLPAR